MPTPAFRDLQVNTDIPPAQQVSMIQDYIVKLIRDLNYLMSNLDTVNINRLDAKVINASTITADKMNVSQLSAIAADLGTITAGIIYGAFIATANGTYPRTEMSNTGNLLQAFKTATNYIKIDPTLTDPALAFISPSIQSFIFNFVSFGNLFVISTNQDMSIQATGTLKVQSSSGSIADIVASINSLNSSISSLTSALAGKADHGSTSSASVSDSHNHGFTTSDYIQCYDSGGVATVKKQWVPYAGSAGHSHTI